MRQRASSNPPPVVVGLGANLGDRRRTLVRAVFELADCGQVIAVSRLYETVAVGPPQPAFLNAAVNLRPCSRLPALLRDLLRIEARYGRVRREPLGPRTLDLDLLWVQKTRLATRSLVLPHPRLRERAFALAPLLDVVPNAADPATGEPYVDLLARLKSTGIAVVESAGWHTREIAQNRAELG